MSWADIRELREVDAISNVTTPISGGKYQPCGAYVGVNELTESMLREMPTMRDVLRDLVPNVGALWVSDVAKGFYTIGATPRAQKLLAVWSVTSPGKVLVPKVIMFGPKNAPAYFDQVMDAAIQGLPIKCVVDDHHGEGVISPSVITAEEKNRSA
jgi:hypothetical protein